MEAKARELVGWNVVAYLSGRGGFGNQVAQEVLEVLLRVGDVVAAMEERGQLAVVALVLDEREGFENTLERTMLLTPRATSAPSSRFTVRRANRGCDNQDRYP